MQDPTFHTRREFLKTTLLGGAACSVMPAFLNQTVQAMSDQAANSALQIATGKDHPILVAIQLAGGNDGLNTLVPYQNDHYYNARPKLGISADKVLKLNDTFGFHPSLAAIKDLYDQGLMNVQQGVGYPNPNRSHFRSTEIWQSASDSNEFSNKGWIGKYFDNACQGEDASVGLALKDEMPLAFASENHQGIAFRDINQYTLQKPRQGQMLRNVEDDEEFFESMNGMGGGSIGSLAEAPAPEGISTLDYLEKVSMNAQLSSQEIQDILKKNATAQSFPNSRFGRDMKTIAQLIGAQYTTRVYFANHGGFDTHSNQIFSHANLLAQYSEGMKAFMDEMKKQGNENRVLVMVFSEFGRRVKENASQGTDHGAAAPVFLFGNQVTPGIHGKEPSLAPEDLLKGDLKYTTDFRSIYASILENHMGVDSSNILSRSFDSLPILKG